MADSEALKRAKALLAQTGADEQELDDAAKALVGERNFGYARELLVRARRQATTGTPRRLELSARLAYCTYKDPDLPREQRLRRALELLGEDQGLDERADAARLNLAGVIHQRRFEASAQVRELERALAYHRRAHADQPRMDEDESRREWAYAGIQAAIVLDQLAWMEEREAVAARVASDVAERRRQEAARIRERVAERTPPPHAGGAAEPDWWAQVTAGEALFGLGRYAEARARLVWARDTHRGEAWDLESAARHLATLARIRPFADDDERATARKVIGEFLREWSAGALSAYRGKVGLALSGGGFRSSFFHIGVLAKLAELDALRHVEVLSCVSGGSIAGTYWYLQLRHLLQTTADGDVTREHYVERIEQMVDQFLAGTRVNVRMTVFGAFLGNLQTINPWSRASRTKRAGDLYESALYARVRDGEEGRERFISGLYVHPKRSSDGKADDRFDPRTDNWRRAAKVPILILNAATLNTGHNFQFTASSMGEPASGLDEDADPAERYRRVRYERAPDAWQQVRLGHAVAASACVPGIFEPLELSGLYEGRTLRLVDGGVHDNQGSDGLLAEDCDVTIVSDAAGQLGSQAMPPAGLIGVPLRSSTILMARVRQAEWRELAARRAGGALRDLFYVHLRKGLDGATVPWEGAEPWDPLDEAPPERDDGEDRELTSYGVRRDVQTRLALIRTDLDAFSDLEAYALMTSGYKMIEQCFEREVEGFDLHRGPRHPWRFLAVEDAMRTHGAESRRLMKVVTAGKSKWGKPFILVPGAVKAVLALAAAAALVAAGFGVCSAFSTSMLTVGAVATVLVVLAVLAALGRIAPRVRAGEFVERAVLGLFLCTFGVLLRWLYRGLDKIYLRAGRAPDAGLPAPPGPAG